MSPQMRHCNRQWKRLVMRPARTPAVPSVMAVVLLLIGRFVGRHIVVVCALLRLLIGRSFAPARLRLRPRRAACLACFATAPVDRCHVLAIAADRFAALAAGAAR